MPRPALATCSVVLLRPLARLLRATPAYHGPLLDEVEKLVAAGERVEFAHGLRIVNDVAELTHDPDVGLKAALHAELGDFEVMEWVSTSAATWRAACETAIRYIRVLNDAAEYRLDIVGDKAHLILNSALPLPRAAADYQIAAYDLSLRLRFPEKPPELEVWFKHARPKDVSVYEAIFPGVKLVFGAQFDGFVSGAWRLEEPLPTANPPLHRVLREHADRLLRELAPADMLLERVSSEILRRLSEGTSTADDTAAQLGMTRRTLTRRLAERGTSYLELLRDARYRMARHYLRNTAHTIEDIAFLLGFAECAPFVRAFKRWCGMTPLEYRRSASVKP